MRSLIAAGAVAGLVSMVVFATVHALVISDIWFFWVPMAIAGAVIGAVIVWSFCVVSKPPTTTRWMLYSAIHVVMLVLLGVASLFAFEPTTSFASLFGPLGLQVADRLVMEAVPLTIVFTFVAAAVVTLIFGRRLWHFGPILAATALVMAALGLNVSILGLIDLQSSSVYAVVEFLALIVIIVGVYSGLMVLVLRRRPLEPVGHRS